MKEGQKETQTDRKKGRQKERTTDKHAYSKKE